MAYKTNYIDVNKPAKVLTINITSINGTERWSYDDGQGDQWWNSGANPRFYKWEIEATVTAQNHGSHLTRQDNQYNGLDVQVGDWIAGASDGICCRIISISAKTSTSVTLIVEDWLRYNTFRSSTGNGIFGTGNAIVFQLNENGHPMLDPLPITGVASNFYMNVNSRFQYLNPQMHYVLDQTAHGFEVGDVISATSSGFAKTTTATAEKVIGTVTNAGPGPNQFMLRPNTRIIDFLPAIPGSPGDFIYTDNSTAGALTTTNTSGRIQFLKITDAIPSSVTGSIADPTTTNNNVIEINEQQVTLTGTVTLAEAISQINTASIDGITASSVSANTEVSTSLSTAYGLVGGYPPFSCTINGSTVNFSTTTAGLATYGIAVCIAEDMATDINNAGLSNIVASKTGSNILKLVETTGGSITIVNVGNDSSGNPFAGPGSVSGLPTSTSGSTSSYLKLTRSDGGEILIDDIAGSPSTDLGIFSVHNGRPPLAVTVEQGIRTAGGTTVVSDITARNALTPQIGDSVYVINTGESEWGYYIYNGSTWVLISDEDSASTDAKSLSYTFTAPVGGFGTIDTEILGSLSPGARILSVLVDTTTPFSGHSSTPEIEVGINTDTDLLQTADENDLETVGQYTTTPGYVYAASNTTELNVQARITHNNATAGEVTVTITYV